MNKLKNSIFKILIELFIFDKVKRSKIKARWAKRYLKKYLDVQVKEQLSTDQNHLPLWSYWHQGKENAPELIQRCFESVQKYEGDRKINILSFDTIKDYVELPQRYYDLVSSGKMPVALFSDILRMYLLTQYGGVWIDSTILLTDKIPQEIIDSSFCVVRKDPEKDNQENKMSCYFIRADKNSPNLNAIKRTLENYWAENDFMINYQQCFLTKLLNLKQNGIKCLILTEKFAENFKQLWIKILVRKSLMNKNPKLSCINLRTKNSRLKSF